MAGKFMWGTWVDSWPRGRFTCTFYAVKPEHGWIEAAGLYRARDGETLTDLDTVDTDIAERALVVGEGGPIRVRAGLSITKATPAIPSLNAG